METTLMIEASGPFEGTEEETRLLQRLIRAKREPGNEHLQMMAKHARDRLVEGYQPLVCRLTGRSARQCRTFEFLDLVNEANIKLLFGIEKYAEGNTDIPFAAVVVLSIKNALWTARREKDGDVRVPRYVAVLYSKILQMEHEAFRRSGEKPSVEALALALRVSPKQIREVQFLMDHHMSMSLQELIQDEDRSVEDRINVVPLYATEVNVETERQLRLAEAVHQAVEQKLTPTQRRVITLRYCLDGEKGEKRRADLVAEMAGISSKHVSSYEKAGYERLRPLLESFVCQEVVA